MASRTLSLLITGAYVEAGGVRDGDGFGGGNG